MTGIDEREIWPWCGTWLDRYSTDSIAVHRLKIIEVEIMKSNLGKVDETCELRGGPTLRLLFRILMADKTFPMQSLR